MKDDKKMIQLQIKDSEWIALPNKIQVRIFKGESGVFIAELPDYGISTEADSHLELPILINDLIFTFFDVPKEFQNAIRYEPERLSVNKDIERELVFQKFISSEVQRIFG